MAKRTKRTPYAERPEVIKQREEVLKAARENACPICGRPIKRNLSIAGWYQCSQYGNENFRVEPDKSACNWQGFTE